MSGLRGFSAEELDALEQRLDELTPEEIDQYAQALGLPSIQGPPPPLPPEEYPAKLAAEHSLHEFARQAWSVVEPDKQFIDGWHIRGICNHLEAALTGEIRNLLVMVPPGCMKSLLTSVFLPTWSWITKPSFRWMFASYSPRLSIRDSMRCRQILQSTWYQQRWSDRFRLLGDQNEKCLARGTHINMWNGASRPIETVQPGQEVHSVDEATGMVTRDTVRHVWCNGRKPTRVLTLSDGTRIEATHNHRFYQWDHWGYVRDLKVGDPVAVVRQTQSRSGGLSCDDAFLLALWIAEGCKNNSGFVACNEDALIRERVEAICARRGWKTRDYAAVMYGVTCGRQRHDATPRALLRKHGMLGCAVNTVRIPDAVFDASDAAVRTFIGTYIACDGHIACGQNKGYSVFSASERLMRDFAFLLKRVGVQSRLYAKPTQGNFESWCLTVHGRAEMRKLHDIHVFAKTGRHNDVQAWCNTPTRHEGGRNAEVPPNFKMGLPGPKFKGRGWASRRSVLEHAIRHGHDELQRKLEADLTWRRIIRIEESEAETWHMETERTSTFVAEGVFSHNTKFENSERGWRLATSVGGATTGEHPDAIVVDDPLKALDAHSDAARERVIEWWDGTITTRGAAHGSRRIVIMQRLHEQDLAGHILEMDAGVGDWQVICLPMRFEEGRMQPTCLGWTDPRKEPGELLWDPPYSETTVAMLERTLQTDAAGQLQQRPAPKAGLMFHAEWFELVDAAPAQPVSRVRYWDKAGTEGKGKYTAGVRACMGQDGIVYVEDVQRAQLEPFGRNKFMRTVAQLDAQETQNQTAQWVEQEPGSAGKFDAQNTVRELAGIPCYTDKVTGSKEARARPLASYAAAGNVRLVRGDWNREFLTELQLFPRGQYSDQVDGISGAFDKLTHGASLDAPDIIASGEFGVDDRQPFTPEERAELPDFWRELSESLQPDYDDKPDGW